MEENVAVNPSGFPFKNDEKSSMMSSKMTLKSRSEVSQHQVDVLTKTTGREYWKSDVSIDKVSTTVLVHF